MPRIPLLAALAAALLAPVAAPLPARAGAPVLLNEIYYDHPGPDGGYEFVELLNPADTAVALAGFRLLAGDGAGPGRWRVLWQGAAADVLPPRARLVLGESSVSPPPDRSLVLGLENAPDALRLEAPDGRADLVGYGPVTYAEYFTGAPASDAPAGYALARSPDGADTGNNARDFVAVSPPTPGAPNRPERDAELRAAWPWARPELVEPGAALAARVTAVNRGLGTIGPGELRVLLWSAPAPSVPPEGEDPGVLGADSLVAEAAGPDPLEPGDSLEVTLSWAPPGAGLFRVAATARLEDDGVDGNHRLEALVRAGPGPLALTEVLYAPRPGEPEWVEVRARGPELLDLRRFRLEDASGRAGSLLPGVVAPFLEPESLAVLTEDAPALCALRPGLDPRRVFTLVPWPALNNATGPGGQADRLVLRDARGAPSDAMAYAGGAAAGYSLERRDPERPGEDAGNWGLSAVDGGTPLAPSSLIAVAPGRAGLTLAPRVWRRQGGGPPRLAIAYRLAWERAVLRLSVVDARGRERARLLEGPSPAVGFLEWDGRSSAGEPLPPGAYALALDARPAEGGGRVRLVEPLVVEP